MALRVPPFTRLTPPQMRRTLGQALLPVADTLRNLLTDFGLSPYTVKLIFTRWSTGERGEGVEIVISEMPIVPTPKITDLTAVTTILTASGLAEQGEIMLSKISGTYTEEQLRGIWPDGRPTDGDTQFFYEIQFNEVQTGVPGERRRFFPTSAPYFDAPALQWRVNLRKQRDDRTRSGDLGE